MMAMREHSASASSIECVVMRIVMLFCICFTVSQIAKRVSGSRPVYSSPPSSVPTVGSSMNSSFGSLISAMPSVRRRFCPPDSFDDT